MIDIAAPHLAIVRDALRRHVPGLEVRAFGSRRKGPVKPYSDLDLVIVGKGKILGPVLAALRDDFEESDLPFRVDVLDWHDLSAEFRQVIAAGYDVLQAGSRAA